MNELILVDSYCKITKTSLNFKRDVTKDEWQKIFNACSQIEGCIQFWIGDLLKYREQKWGMYDDIVEQTGRSIQNLKDIKWVSEKVSCRQDDLSFEHHKQVASLKTEKQKDLLQKASVEKLTVKEIREEVKKIKRGDEFRIEQEKPNGKYEIIYIDPPWHYPTNKAFYGQDVERHYPTMTNEELLNMDIKQYADINCVLYLWCTAPLLDIGIELLKAWGFDYKTCVIWDKVKHNMGFYASIRHEILLIGGIGKSAPTDKSYANQTDSVYVEERTEHSKKPKYYYEMIEKMHPLKIKRIEFFARNKIENWDSWGNEIE